MILLFRPFGSQKEIAGITSSPWELCTTSANSIVTLLKLYRSRFSLRYIVNSSVHILFTASIVHLVNATSSNESLRRSSKNALRSCALYFSEIGRVWASATKSLRVVESLQRKWARDPTTEETSPIATQDTLPIIPKAIEPVKIMPSVAQQDVIEAFVPVAKVVDFSTEEFKRYFLPSQTQATPGDLEEQALFGNSNFWDYLPFLEDGYDGYPFQDPV